jgi:hypothetical protein
MSKAQTPNNDAVAKMAELIVKKEITRMLGPAGGLALMKIGALLQLVHPLYKHYYDVVDTGVIQLEDVAKHFSKEVWAAMTSAKRRTLESAIKKEVGRQKQQIHNMAMVLWENDTQLATLSPKGQAALSFVMQELLGTPEVAAVVAPVEHWANGNTCAKCGSSDWMVRDEFDCNVCHEEEEGAIAA